jgi:hypothetical protein
MTATTQPLTQQCRDSFTWHGIGSPQPMSFSCLQAHISGSRWSGERPEKKRRAGHICCALFPHYLLRDSIPRRMLPCRSFR